MRTFFVCLAAAGAAFTTWASDIPQVSTTSNTGLAGDKRDSPTATVTLGPSSLYSLAVTSGASSPSGTSFTIIETIGSASVGFNFIPGPDLRTQISSALAQCSGTPNADCINDIANLLPDDQVDIQRRQVALLAMIGVGVRYVIAGIIGAATGWGLGKAVNAYHAPMSNANQAQSPTAASAYAFVTGTSASAVVVTVQSSETPDPTPYIQAAASGSAFSINANDQTLSQNTNDLAAQNSGHCPGPQKRSINSLQKRDPPDEATIACLVALTITLIRNVIDGPLANWVRVNRNNRQIAPAGAGAAVVLANVHQEVAPFEQAADLADIVWDDVERVAYWEAYNRVVLQRDDGQVVQVSEDDINLQYCPGKDYLLCSDSHCKGSSGQCADSSDLKGCDCNDSPTGCPAGVFPACGNCGGASDGSKCGGVNGIMQGCSCWNQDNPGDNFFSSIDDFNTAQQTLLSLKDLPDPPPAPTDGTNGPPAARCPRRKRDDDTIEIDTQYFAGLTEVACLMEVGDPFPSFDRKLTNALQPLDQYKQSYPGLTIDYKWDAKTASCGNTTCYEIFESFLHNNTDCAPSSTSMATSGSLSMDCGTASYSISSGLPVPSSTTSSSTTTPSSTSTPTYSGPSTCVSAGWKGGMSDILLSSRPWCASFGDGKTFDQSNELGSCSAPLPNQDIAQGNVNDPPLGSLVNFYIRQDPKPECSSVPLNTISFSNGDCWDAIKTAVPDCPVPGDGDNTPGANFGINCALYGYFAAAQSQKTNSCPTG